MKKLIGAIAVFTLTGCATTHYVDKDGRVAADQDVLACNYEARKATAGIVNGIQAGWEQAELRDMCLRTKGYTRKRI